MFPFVSLSHGQSPGLKRGCLPVVGVRNGRRLRIYGFTDLPPSLPLPPADPRTRITESSRRRPHHEEEQVCQLATPAQIACAECPGCARVAGELTSRRAAEINLTINYALNVDTLLS